MVNWSEYYKNNKDRIKENQETYQEKIKSQKNFSDSDYNYYYREQTAKKRGMTTSEYNSYLEYFFSSLNDEEKMKNEEKKISSLKEEINRLFFKEAKNLKKMLLF